MCARTHTRVCGVACCTNEGRTHANVPWGPQLTTHFQAILPHSCPLQFSARRAIPGPPEPTHSLSRARTNLADFVIV